MNKVIGVTKIAQMLNDKQILTPTKHKELILKIKEKISNIGLNQL